MTDFQFRTISMPGSKVINDSDVQSAQKSRHTNATAAGTMTNLSNTSFFLGFLAWDRHVEMVFETSIPLGMNPISMFQI
jgi:hypothetical protein